MITLHNVSGMTVKSGQDNQGNAFTQFFVDYLAEQEDGQCVQCDAVLDMGWMCLDGGDEYCFEHIRDCSSPDSCPQCERLTEVEIRS